MAYTLQAWIASDGVFGKNMPSASGIVQLNRGMAMIPVTSSLRNAYGIPWCPLTDDGKTEMPAALCDLCITLSQGGSIAYVEAELFGGFGAQAHALFRNGAQVGAIAISGEAINEALRWLGVSAGDGMDEFEAVGLGRHRDTDAWLG